MAKQHILKSMGIPFECWFWSNVDTLKKANDCWIWRKSKGQNQYKNILKDGKHASAHRVAYELTKGGIPKGMFICHSCDNPICCNPNHLWVGTQQDNMNDMSEKGRAGRKPSMTKEQLSSVQHMIDDPNIFMKDVANEIGVSRSTIYRAIRRYK